MSLPATPQLPEAEPEPAPQPAPAPDDGGPPKPRKVGWNPKRADALASKKEAEGIATVASVSGSYRGPVGRAAREEASFDADAARARADEDVAALEAYFARAAAPERAREDEALAASWVRTHWKLTGAAPRVDPAMLAGLAS